MTAVLAAHVPSRAPAVAPPASEVDLDDSASLWRSSTAEERARNAWWIAALRASGVLASAGVNSLVTSSTFIGNVQGAYLNATGLTFGLAGQGNVLTGNASTTAGIFMTGAAAGTIVQGNGISQATTGISINSVTGALIGGTGAGQFNTVAFATTGVFGTGTCSGSSVVKTAFGSAVTTKYNTAGARGLSVIQ